MNTDIVTVTITGGPMGVQVQADPVALCLGATSNISTQTGGGSGIYNYSWTSDPAGFNSTLEDITIQPDVTTTYYLTISDGFSTLTRTVTVNVYPNPVVNPGAPQTIPNGTTTTLTGIASGGFSPYSFSWEPADLLVNPLQSMTLTDILSNTTNFTLTVSDGHGCVSSSEVLVTIAGGPLNVQPQAIHSPLCLGESTRLLPLSEGGSGNYSYTWTATGGYSSTQSEPTVTPNQTTTYKLTISDGFTQDFDSVTVFVNPLPFINLIPQGAHIWNGDTIMACIFDTLTISAVNPNATYLWSNGANTPEIQSATTGIAFDMLSYSVDVLNSLTGCSNTGNITIIYTYSECTYGTSEQESQLPVKVFPNPGNGYIHCEIGNLNKDIDLEVFNVQGVLLHKQKINKKDASSLSLDLSHKPSGVYILRFSDGQNTKGIRLIKY
ncbi:MAG: T9SS type A sorting domain-containing protein [Bacteroidales bacterium]|nr:T9SS type A sorting domain-containing protein [Bacteroidales bacterium]